MSEAKMYKNGDRVPVGMEDEAYSQMTEKQDLVDNAIFTMLNTLANSVGKKLEWDMALIATIRETVLEELANARVFVPYPGLVDFDEDNPDAGHIYCEYEFNPEDYDDDDCVITDGNNDDSHIILDNLDSLYDTIDDLSMVMHDVSYIGGITENLCEEGAITLLTAPDVAVNAVFDEAMQFGDVAGNSTFKNRFINRQDDFKNVFKDHILKTVARYYKK